MKILNEVQFNAEITHNFRTFPLNVQKTLVKEQDSYPRKLIDSCLTDFSQK